MSDPLPVEIERPPNRRLMLIFEIAALCGIHIPTFLATLTVRQYVLLQYPFTPNLVYIAATDIFRAFLYLFVITVSGDPLREFGLRRVEWKRDIPALLAMAAGTIAIYWSRFGVKSSSETVHLGYAPLSLLLITMIIVGFAEELFFRGYLINRVEELTGKAWLAVLFQAAFFGLLHLRYGLNALPTVIEFGLVAGVVYVWNRSIWTIALIHGLLDFALYYLRFY